MGKTEKVTGTLPPQGIIRFIRRHHVLTLATVSGQGPWCSNMFYAYLPEENSFVFTSEERTRHISDLLQNPNVAASIVLETRTVGKVQGLQIEGIVEKDPGETKYRHAYLSKFPYAAVAQLDIWVLRPSLLKLTDNTLGFGKKIVWEKP
ncbi:MAG: pyridoxamine 5'-phosphate oxidase family protein [Alistipes sp.]|nr:pyridoxamine 5'-phosphate oxidase family protein [Alistipes sp.]